MLCIKRNSAAGGLNGAVGQCESFMAAWMESVMGNLLRPQEEGRTLTQSLAPRQERGAHIETAPKH